MSRHLPPIPTLSELAANCQHNVRVAEHQIQATRQHLARAGLGPERNRLLVDLSRYQSDYHHWSDYVGHYRARAVKEGADVIPRMSLFGRDWGAQIAEAARQRMNQQPDRRLPREPGDDDDEVEAPR